MFPIYLVLILPFQDSIELSQTLSPIIGDGTDYVSIDYIAQYPTLNNFKELIVFTPDFYKVFWNSLFMVTLIILFQILVAVPSAWAFSQFKFKGKKILFNCYVLFMLMPFQVTMLSQYLVLDKLNLLNTRMAIILPAVFSTFSVFLIYRKFSEIPKDICDSARIDGAGELKVLWHIGIPLGKSGILSCAVLSFLDLFNMVEQPLTFLRDKKLFPLSLYLPEIGMNDPELMIVASLVTLIPSAFVFIIGQDYMEQGIIASALKE
jgi:sugar permease